MRDVADFRLDLQLAGLDGESALVRPTGAVSPETLARRGFRPKVRAFVSVGAPGTSFAAPVFTAAAEPFDLVQYKAHLIVGPNSRQTRDRHRAVDRIQTLDADAGLVCG